MAVAVLATGLAAVAVRFVEAVAAAFGPESAVVDSVAFVVTELVLEWFAFVE